MKRVNFNSPKISGKDLINTMKEECIELIILSSSVLKGNQAILSETILTVSEEAYDSVVDIDTSAEAIKSLDINVIPLKIKL
ncbi:hypothetical protein [Spirosoma pomorum]